MTHVYLLSPGAERATAQPVPTGASPTPTAPLGRWDRTRPGLFRGQVFSLKAPASKCPGHGICCMATLWFNLEAPECIAGIDSLVATSHPPFRPVTHLPAWTGLRLCRLKAPVHPSARSNCRFPAGPSCRPERSVPPSAAGPQPRRA